MFKQFPKLLVVIKYLLYVINAYFLILALVGGIYWIQNPEVSSMEPLLLMITLILSGITVLIRKFEKMQSPLILSNSNSDIEKYFPKIDFNKRLIDISNEIKSYLFELNEESDWGFDKYTVIEAEVELVKNNSKKRKLLKITDAIKQNSNDSFLILGEPGSGKSVSLRKLCYLFAEQTYKTNRIPIYINLKEWLFDDTPSTEQLYKFIIDYIKGLDKKVLNDLLFEELEKGETYFDKMFQQGYFYFIFDSFDEIPRILTADANSIVIKNVTRTISEFIKASKSNGILSSRIYKAPQQFSAKITLNLLPFDDVRINETLRKYRIPDEIIKKVFLERPDLVQLFENPFSLMLFVVFYNERNRLPDNQAEMYSEFIRTKIQSTILAYTADITLEQSLIGGKDIAKMMHENKRGLEISIRDDIGHDPFIFKVTDLLKKAKLGRGLTVNKNIFGFTHRRIAEYFVVQNIIENKIPIDLEEIPSMGKNRDALILYAELVDEDYANEIADYCVNQIITSKDPLSINALHSLTFLIAAFQNRLGHLSEILKPLYTYTFSIFSKSKDIYIQKKYIETLKLMDDKNVERVGLFVFKIGNSWLNETVILCTRKLSKISKEFKHELKDYIADLEYIYFFKKLPNMLFSFSLNKSFAVGKFYCYLKIADLIFFLLVLAKYTHFELFVVNYWVNIFNQSDYVTAILAVAVIILCIRMVFTLGIHLATIRLFFIFFFLSEVFKGIINDGFLNSIGEFELHLFILGISLMGIRVFDERIWKFRLKFYHYVSIIIPILFFIITFLLITRFDTKNIGKLQLPVKISEVVVALFFISVLWFTNKLLIVDYFRFRKIKRTLPKTREEVYSTLMHILKSDSYKKKYVKLLENNLYDISGSWPDRQIFNVENNKEYLIALAKLDEKWNRIE